MVSPTASNTEPVILTQPSLAASGTSHHVALVLAGCGHRDGAEITEAVSLMVALSERGFRVQMFAPDRPSAQVVNHRTGQQDHGVQRNILDEAARVARGKIAPLATLEAHAFDALVFAGGFGVAYNLCNFATAGAQAVLTPDTAAALASFYDAGKPIGALCIAPILLAAFARDRQMAGVHLTFGDGSAKDVIEVVSGWGVRAMPCGVRQSCVDSRHRMVSSPAYMQGDANPADIMASGRALVEGLGQLLVGDVAGHHDR